MRERTDAEIEAAVRCFRDKGVWLQKHTMAEALAAADAVAPAAARIEALEAALENEAIVSRDAFARIEALEAALREANRPVRWRRQANGWRR